MRLALTLALFAVGNFLTAADEDYKPGPDAEVKEGVPKGEVTQHSWTSKIFPGTVRDYWVYVPAQYDSTVFDNLIHAGEMPVTIGIFINPGKVPAAKKGQEARSNRSFEYDTLSDQYARFLMEEMIPEVAKGYNLTKNPDARAICGNSSGGIAAFTVAWERPDEFRKVISHIGSFTNIRGGHVYPALIRKTDKKPLRVFIQDGENDLDNLHGNWPLSNQQMAAAFEFSKYDHKFVLGTGRHSGRHGGAIFPDTLRWLWRDWKELQP